MRYWALAAIGLLLAVTPLTPAHADDGVPDDVKEVFATRAVQDMHDNTESTVVGGSPVDLREVTGFGVILEKFLWSREFLSGSVTDAPIRSIDEWIAPALRDDGEAVGTYWVWRPQPGAPAEFAGFDDDSELGTALKGVPEGAQLVEDPTIAGWYSVKDGLVTALNSQAAAEVPTPIPLDEFQPILAERRADAIEASRGPWYGNEYVIVGAFVALAVARMLAVAARRRRSAG